MRNKYARSDFLYWRSIKFCDSPHMYILCIFYIWSQCVLYFSLLFVVLYITIVRWVTILTPVFNGMQQGLIVILGLCRLFLFGVPEKKKIHKKKNDKTAELLDAVLLLLLMWCCVTLWKRTTQKLKCNFPLFFSFLG